MLLGHVFNATILLEPTNELLGFFSVSIRIAVSDMKTKHSGTKSEIEDLETSVPDKWSVVVGFWCSCRTGLAADILTGFKSKEDFR